MNNYFSALIISLSVIFFVSCTSNNEVLNKKLTEMAVELNASAPVMLDPYTQFDGASVTNNNVFRYEYTIKNTSDAERMVHEKSETIKDEMKNQYKTDPSLRIFTENDVTIEYIYKNSDGKVIQTITIVPEDYK